MTPLRSTAGGAKRPPRGQPVIALVMILALWIAVRATMIALEPQAAFVEPVAPSRLIAQAPGPPHREARVRSAPRTARKDIPPRPGDHGAGIASLAASDGPRRSWFGEERTLSAMLLAEYVKPVESLLAWPRDQGEREAAAEPASGEAGSAAFALPRFAYRADPPPGKPAAAPAGADMQTPARPPHLRQTRWSADGWLLLRGGDLAPALAGGAASYGGSQAGAVVRYAVVPASPLRPQVYFRGSGAVGGSVRQNEAALGLAVRPLRRLPLALMGEWRLQDQGGPVRSRPVVMAVTELPPLRLPLSMQAEAYGQAGWAGGRDATAFYDLAVTLQRRVIAPLPRLQLSAGGGVWSGGQRGAARLDMGPRIELRGQLGPPARSIGVRVGVDWRFRVAGRAEPGSGPALTVAAGF